MKKLLYILSFAGLMGFGSCSDELNTEPTDSVSGSTIFENVTNAQSAINGVYRMLYVAGWSSNWGTENCGQTGIQLLADLMAVRPQCEYSERVDVRARIPIARRDEFLRRLSDLTERRVVPTELPDEYVRCDIL